MYNFTSKNIFVAFVFAVGSLTSLRAQELLTDSTEVSITPNIYIKASGGPAILGLDIGYYFQNEIIFEFSKNLALIGSYAAGNSYAGMKNVMRLYLAPEEILEDDFVRQQTMLSLNLGMQASIINSQKHRFYFGLGPGLNFYNASEGTLLYRGNMIIHQLSNKRTLRLAINYFAGYELKAFEHLVFGVSFFGSQVTEDLYSVLLSVGYRF